ncbi:MAG: acyl-CoA dehydrogenase family protein [Alphaproteobacteria bacterium]
MTRKTAAFSFEDTATHQVENQPPPFEGHNSYLEDRALVEGLKREGGAWAEPRLIDFGRTMASAQVQKWAHDANRFLPELRSHDRFGNRVDEVDFHPSYHALLGLAKGAALHALPWTEKRSGAHVARVAAHMVFNKTENGISCPIAMTFAGVPALRAQPELASLWEPRLIGTEYDSSFQPAKNKKSALMGMAMTEKQGGSDVRANTTRAVPIGKGGPGGEYELTGHKWFCSAPMCDAFLTLAQTEKGLSCFLVPRWLEDGTRNRFFIQRLKDKLGNLSNASSEIEYNRTYARMVGGEGRGVATIIEMVHHTRLECAMGAAAIMRQAVALAFHHARYRRAFQRKLIDQPLMRNVLADLGIEAEAATILVLRVARGFDESATDDAAKLFTRIATPIAKYWTCKRVTGAVYEALECHGGAGYVEEMMLARLYREAPLNGIWEGSGNVICLDVLRALEREPDTALALLAELERAKGGDKNYDRLLASLKDALAAKGGLEPQARRVVEQMAMALQMSLLIRHAPNYMADAFGASRLAGEYGHAYGTLPARLNIDAIVERAMPNTEAA